MERRLFCELGPHAYKLSVGKERLKRHVGNLLKRSQYTKVYQKDDLPLCVYRHKSLIMRQLGNSDLELQYNKRDNLKLTAPKLDGLLIKPGETFSFWQIVGKCSKSKGYLEGVTISAGEVRPGIAGGMCQMTNLIHWMVLHSSLEIVEHHHHHRYDIFPDYKRQIPFGTGTSIMYNYLDYQFRNPTQDTFQLRIRVSEKYLEGELRVNREQDKSYHIIERSHRFILEGEKYFRCNEIYRKIHDKRTGNLERDELLLKNKSLVLYDHSLIHWDK